MIIDAFTVLNGWPMLSAELTEKDMLAQLAEFKVDKACVISSKGIFSDARTGNEATINAAKNYSDKLIPIGTVDPRVSIDEEIDFCVSNGIKIVALFPETQDWDVDSLLGKKLLSAVNAAGLPMMIEMADHHNVKRLAGIMDKITVPVILQEVSLLDLSEVMVLLENHKNIHLTTRLLSGADTIEMIAEKAGADRLIFSSRMPVSSFSAAFLAARYAKVSPADLNGILSENIMRILNINI